MANCGCKKNPNDNACLKLNLKEGEHKFVYLFQEGDASMRNLLGGKGCGLAEMTKIGLPVPKGFSITTEACTQYYADNRQINDVIMGQVEQALVILQKETGKTFGDVNNPLLVSVRSGARVSMPGMMDTILNLGLNDIVVEGLAKLTNNPRFAYDAYRRFITMFSDVAMELPRKQFDAILDAHKAHQGVTLDSELNAEELKGVVKEEEALYKELKGEAFPQDPQKQLYEAIRAVFRSWDNPRANTYRKLNNIPYSWGTAVNVQEMVFGNMGPTSGTGVAFTRNPVSGEKVLWGEYLLNAQGEDVVAGIRTPSPIAKLHDELPGVFEQFKNAAETLEKHYKDMQDMEYTIENGKLFMLQTRNGKRTAVAGLKIAIDMVSEGLLTKEEAIMKVEPTQLNALLHPQFNEDSLKKAPVITTALAASPGAATGKVCFTAQRAKELVKAGEKKVILVRAETSPEDIEGMVVAQGILTERGGMTSHAAVVARGLGACCVAGASQCLVNEDGKFFVCNGKKYSEGDWISLDGNTGKVYEGQIVTEPAKISGDFATFMGWADEIRKLQVRTNADTPEAAKTAFDFGAQGVGLVRTEHMFFNGAERIKAFREMILAVDVEGREKALAKLLPMQRSDFEGIYRAMEGRPVVIRYLDPPLHEFVPKTEEEIVELAQDLGRSVEEVKATCDSLKEFNPMLGHRGCRLDVSYPEIGVMQTRAVIEAACNVTREGKFSVKPEIMIPIVCDVNELKYVKGIIKDTIEKVFAEQKMTLPYEIGTMIEVPRAALLADEIASEAEFFSFGTNDLTQTTFAFSRDDAGKFLEDYYTKKIFDADPFAHLDQHGVGKLMKYAVEQGRSVNPNLVCGICGEHGGDHASIEFCHNIGLTYVSCSPFRVPIARLAAAQAQVKNPRK